MRRWIASRHRCSATACDPGDAIALCAAPSTRYATLFLGALRAGVVVAPLAPSVTPASFASMLDDAEAQLLFVDDSARAALGAGSRPALRHVSLDGVADGVPFDDWLAPATARPDAGRRPARMAVQHHLFVRHDRAAEGHRAVARDALGARARAAACTATTATA